ncbi:glycosyltransferase family 2 protein [Saliphagus sp. LR7]|uniref:glycosyltransferase family 2 protein n=1 Tax=Saliphagus sp. LR7 TaxID=2282654 RepID=UPI000DF80C7A|nr:glycosyltransferase family 2 protein [Saliphagus sp. LR7]
MEGPTVSVVVPTHNRCRTLPRAIDSVLSGTYDDFELLVVDDGSTDATPEVVADYDDDRIRYLRFEENRGANAARNAGIEAARGEFVSFLDSDDAFRPRHLEVAAGVLSRAPATCDGVCTSYARIRGGAVGSIQRVPEGVIDRAAILDGNPIGSLSATTFRRSVLEAVGGFDEDLPSAQDYDLYVRVSEGSRLRGIGEVLVDHHTDGDRISHDVSRQIRGYERIVEKHGDAISDRRRAHQRFLIAFLYADRGEIDATRRELRTALSLHPTNPRYHYFYLAARLGGSAFAASRRLKDLGNRLYRRELPFS